MKEYSKAITPTRERTARPIRVASFFFVVLLPGKSSACSSAGVRGCAPRVPHVRCSHHCLQGCGDVPRVLPVDVCCAAPRCAGSLAQVQWIPMMLTSEASDPRTHVPRRDAHAPGARAALLTLRRCLFSSCECACRAPTEGASRVARVASCTCTREVPCRSTR